MQLQMRYLSSIRRIRQIQAAEVFRRQINILQSSLYFFFNILVYSGKALKCYTDSQKVNCTFLTIRAKQDFVYT